jgi:hypothetical protein
MKPLFAAFRGLATRAVAFYARESALRGSGAVSALGPLANALVVSATPDSLTRRTPSF